MTTLGADRGRGVFLTLEGGEGAGKSTQARRLAAHLSAQGIPVLLTREPGGAPGAEAIRAVVLGGHGLDPIAEALLMFAARREHLVQTIRPALAAGLWVVCDRFADSTLAYQVHGQGVPRAVFDSLCGIALDGVRPDRTLILDVPVEVGLRRAVARGVAADRYERLGVDFHARIRAGFLALARDEPERCVVVDASGDADAVFAEIVHCSLPRSWTGEGRGGGLTVEAPTSASPHPTLPRPSPGEGSGP